MFFKFISTHNIYVYMCIAIARRMTPLAQQLYNTRRLVGLGSPNTVIDDDDEDEYYDRIGEDGILPSNHLHACYGCAVTVINGQFYGFWKEAVENGLQRGTSNILYVWNI